MSSRASYPESPTSHRPSPGQRRGSDPLIGSDSALLASGPSSLDAPRRMVDLGTGLPSLTSLFTDFKPIAEEAGGVTVLYIHIPSSAIVEERFGWEALEAYRGLIANFLVGFGQNMRRERSHCVLARAYADDFLIVTPSRDSDGELPTTLAESMTRHLSAIDEETAALLQIYVGLVQGKPFSKIHPERFLYRMIQQSLTEATDVSRQRLSGQVRILDRCISTEMFNMVYQPIVHMEDHSIFAHEALVRCPQQELRNPHILFNVATEGDRIWPLSRLLRRLAIDALPQLPEPMSMFLNLHPQDFDDPEIIAPGNLLAQFAPRLVLEITERAAIQDVDSFRDRLSEVRGQGLRIAVDDLGSGYSTLNLVTELSPEYLKLDMTLVRGIDESPVRQNLLRNIVAFANDIDAKIVAEGVETRPELETLWELGCHFVQGYYLAVPSPPFVLTIEKAPACTTLAPAAAPDSER